MDAPTNQILGEPEAQHFQHASESDRPVIFDQSANVTFVNVPELLGDPGLHEEWCRQYNTYWEKIWATQSIAGAQVFNLNDDQYLLPRELLNDLPLKT